MPARSQRTGSASRSSSATRPRSSTTTTAWCSTTVERGNPTDAPQLAPAVGRVIRRAGRRPRTVTARRGYGEAKVEVELHQLGVRTVVIPHKGRPGKARQAHERGRAFPRTVKVPHRQGGSDQHLKRGYRWDRTRLDDLEGAHIWRHEVLAHNCSSRRPRRVIDHRTKINPPDPGRTALLRSK
jgi:IS5 family transposase